jgi:hypothetical protein
LIDGISEGACLDFVPNENQPARLAVVNNVSSGGSDGGEAVCLCCMMTPHRGAPGADVSTSISVGNLPGSVHHLLELATELHFVLATFLGTRVTA